MLIPFITIVLSPVFVNVPYAAVMSLPGGVSRAQPCAMFRSAASAVVLASKVSVKRNNVLSMRTSCLSMVLTWGDYCAFSMADRTISSVKSCGRITGALPVPRGYITYSGMPLRP